MKNSNDIIGNQTRDLPACSTVPQLTAPTRAPPSYTRKQIRNSITKQAMYNLLTTMYQQQGILINHRMETMVNYTPR